MPEKPTLNDCMTVINAASRKEPFVRLAVAFGRLYQAADEAIGGDCVIFTMTEPIAKSLCDMEKLLPQGIEHMELRLPASLSAAVLYKRGEKKQIVTPLGKGGLDDALIETGYCPDRVFLRVFRDKVAVVVKAMDNRNYLHEAGALMPKDSLLAATRGALSMSAEDAENAREELLDESGPRMGLH